MRIAIIKNSGLCAGGIEKYLQQIAVELVVASHSVDFFYTDGSPCGHQRIPQPRTDEGRKKFLLERGVTLKEIQCEYFDPLEIGGKWHNTDFYEHFSADDYDVVIGGHKGEPCWPFSEIRGPKIVETVHGTDFTSGASNYADAYILISDYQKDRWVRAGGDLQRTHIIYPMVEVDTSNSNRDRNSWGLPPDRFIFGMHQSARTGLFSSVPLDAYAAIQSDNNFFVLLGGTDEYTDYAKSRGISNFMRIPPVSDSSSINSFLSCLDVYSHGRMDGEVCSSAIIEAMANNLPVITHPSTCNNGHLLQVEDCGFVANSIHDYAGFMTLLQTNSQVYNDSSSATFKKYESTFSFKSCRKSLIDLINNITREQ